MNYSTSGKSLHSKLLRMKFISCILAPTIASTSFCATNSASEPTKPQDSKVHNSQKSSSTLETIAKEAAICSGAVLLIVGSALCGKKYFSAETPQENPTPSTQEGSSSPPSAQESNSTASKQENLTETRILHYPSEPLSTDVWFTQLGGNSNDIAEYLGMNVPIVDSIEDLRMNSYTYDGKGVYYRENLGETVAINAKRNQILKDLFYRIFAIHNYKTKKTYTRFYSPYFEIVLSKFLVDSNTTLESLSPETEAKIFYILSKILTTAFVYDKHGIADFEKIPNISALTKNPIYQTLLKSIQEPGIAWENIWLSSGRNCLSCPQFLEVWDVAIMNISNPANSSNELRQNLDAILSRLFLKYASESGITNGRELSDAIKNGGMSRFYENFDNFRAALQDLI